MRKHTPEAISLATLFPEDAGVKLPWWDQRAIDLQKNIIAADLRDKEAGLKGIPELPVTSFEVRKAILHTRHDIVLLWSSLSSVNGQLQSIKRLLFAVVALLAYLAFKS